MKKILLIGSGGREHAIAKAIKKSPQPNKLLCFAGNANPAIQELCATYHMGDLQNVKAIIDFAAAHHSCTHDAPDKIDFAIIGPEFLLASSIVDLLKQLNIPTVGPTQRLAQIETSKGFARDLLQNHAASFLPRYKRFTTINGVKNFLQLLGDDFVIKADGLMSGKGVKVSQEHLFGHNDAINYCNELLTKNYSLVIEEKFIGQEFSLLSFSDGKHLVHMPLVQDHKRAFVGDSGPNTGGMGSYSDVNHALPFLNEHDVAQAQLLNQITVDALAQKYGELYQGILYGGFMLTKDGVKLIEYNARFGDPEAINILALLQSDFIAICSAIVCGKLDQIKVAFTPQATVCKYLVPIGYPDHPQKNKPFDVTALANQDELYYAAVDAIDSKLYTTDSRTIAVLGIADNIIAAEKMAETVAQKITGSLFHRTDIGSAGLINKKIAQINQLCSKNYSLL